MKPDISIILPVLNEEKRINSAIQNLENHAFEGSLELIVVDGHPRGTTLEKIKNKETIKLVSDPGRGIQMNAGAAKATGDIILFLHCDTLLPKGALDAVTAVMENSSIQAGAFDLEIDGKKPVYRMIEKSASLRSRFTKIPYGDQAVFIRKSYFFSIGQFNPIPIMEDVDLMRKIKKKGDPIHILDLTVTTSARRWEQEGILYGTLRNWMLLTLFSLGVKPEILVRFYKS